jgi:hypothetical protein
VTAAYETFGVATLRNAGGPVGEIRGLEHIVPSVWLIDAPEYFHSDHETSATVPAAGTEAVTRAFAQIPTTFQHISISGSWSRAGERATKPSRSFVTSLASTRTGRKASSFSPIYLAPRDKMRRLPRRAPERQSSRQ